jgi:UDP-glucose 4-epimerase
MKKNYLVIGGAGYIGSHLVQMLSKQGHYVTVYDDLSTGHYAAIFAARNVENSDYFVGDYPLSTILMYPPFQRPYDAVFHFAGNSQVGESMIDPMKYFKRNVSTSIEIINACMNAGVKKFVFSSSAAVYKGNRSGIYSELAPVEPISPYGESKLMVENVLKWVSKVSPMKHAILRYFNAAGCDPDGILGEDHRPETHLIPNVIDVALGRKEKLEVYGDDHSTYDGTAVRDYVHVTDICEAHILALKYINEDNITWNLGSGNPHTVLNIIQTAEKVIGTKIPYDILPNRKGDPAFLVANADEAIKHGWRTRYSDIETIIQSTYHWRKTHPNGYDN